MNFTENLVLKENYTFLVAGEDAMVAGGEHGLYNRDTRFLSRYCWMFSDGFRLLVSDSSRSDLGYTHHALIVGPEQLLGVSRTLQIDATGLTDELLVANTSLATQKTTLRLELDSDFADLFEVRGWHQTQRDVGIETSRARATFTWRSSDGLEQEVAVTANREPIWDGPNALFHLELGPGQELRLQVRTELSSPLETSLPLPDIDTWRERFPAVDRNHRHSRVIQQAITDLRGLLLATDEGQVAAAVIPWFVTTFGRDSLITASMLARWQADLARGTLRHLAARQGTTQDAARSEEPGKILHELRQGELARSGVVPFGRYYGSIDATMLFLLLLGQLADRQLTQELQPNWQAALSWLLDHADPDGDGFFEFTGAREGKGLTVQSWKDSHDSLSHADGRLASGAIAVSEVQGYAYSALTACAEFYAQLGDHANALRCQERSEQLKRQFHEMFWLEHLQTYALALDGDKQPLQVRSSDAGQLLWTGIVPEEIAPTLVESLFADDMWSGWGFRTLSSREVRYNPLSYHNGSVWPHDTALTGLGLFRYGFKDEARRIREALLDLAASQPDLRAPELISGYARGSQPAVPYPVACRPQAWSAAALLTLLEV